jgi:hypothetical protein
MCLFAARAQVIQAVIGDFGNFGENKGGRMGLHF